MKGKMNIKLNDRDKIRVNRPDDLFQIMRRILLRENKVDQEKEHFWMIGLNHANVILYIELISLGSSKSTPVEPMNVYRIAVMKGATRVIAVHNHPSGMMAASERDKEVTDRLIQVGRILDITLEDHLIISTTTYLSFRAAKLMDELEQSIKYVPTFQLIERIRKEELAMRSEAEKIHKEEIKQKKQELQAKEAELLHYKQTAIKGLQEKNISIEEISAILNLTPKEIQQILKRGN